MVLTGTFRAWSLPSFSSLLALPSRAPLWLGSPSSGAGMIPTLPLESMIFFHPNSSNFSSTHTACILWLWLDQPSGLANPSLLLLLPLADVFLTDFPEKT